MAKIFTNNNKLMTIGNSFLCKYEPPLYNITYSQVTGGAFSGPASAHENDTVNVTATPDTNYNLDYITVNGSQITGTSFSMPAQDSIVSGVFKLPPQLQYYNLVIEKAAGYFCPAINDATLYTSYLDTNKSYKYTYGGVASQLSSSDLYQMFTEYGIDFGQSYGKVSLAIKVANLPSYIQFKAGQSHDMYRPIIATLYAHYSDSSETLISTVTCSTDEWTTLQCT